MKRISLLFIFALLFGACNQNQRSESPVPNDKAINDPSYLKGVNILNKMYQSLGVSDDTSALARFYNFSKMDNGLRIEQAKKAFDCFDKALINFSGSSEAYVDCLEKLAISCHFQQQNFAYHYSLPGLYYKKLEYIDSAIKCQKKFPPSTHLAQMYENAAQMARPKMYLAMLSKNEMTAEKITFKYLEQAAQLYLSLGENRSALKILRYQPKDSIKNFFKIIELARKTEGDSPELVEDISGLFHFMIYHDLTDDEKILANKYADIGVSICFRKRPEIEIFLLKDVACYFKKQLSNPEKSLKHYLRAQELEEENKESVYHTAFCIAAIYMENKNWQLANEQFQKALKEELSPTDYEHAFFGLAMISHMSGNKKEALEIWKKHITDKEIMNGVSAFQSLFSAGKKKMIAENALELISSAGAKNAKRIVEENWIK